MNWLGGARSRMNNQDPRTNNNNANETNEEITINGQQVRRRSADRLFNLARDTFPGEEGEILAMHLKWVMEIEKIRPRSSTSASASASGVPSRSNNTRSRTSSTSTSASDLSSNVSLVRGAVNIGNENNLMNANDSRSSIISSISHQPQPRTVKRGNIEEMMKETNFISQSTICQVNNDNNNDGNADSPDSMDEILSQMDIPSTASTVASGSTIAGRGRGQIINDNINNISISDIFAPTPTDSSKEMEVIYESNFDMGILTPPSPTISEMSTSTK